MYKSYLDTESNFEKKDGVFLQNWNFEQWLDT